MPESSKSVRSSPKYFKITLLAVATALLGGARFSNAQTGKPAAESIEFFEKNVRPLLISRCQDCHGEKKSWANLRLDSASGLKAGGENGAVVVAGKPTESELYRRITSSEEGVQMPPADSGKKLSPAEIEHLKHWIELGAIWPESPAAAKPSNAPHWAFQPLTHPEPPPQVAGESANPIDRFIAAKRQEHSLGASPIADRRTLIRRASYDLLGLPPSSAEVEAFSGDQDADAFAKLIDRLLKSPRYGEQWARHWLDVARFSDTKGYVYAREEREFYHASHYRDWVIKAFNDDLPYDRFLLLQLAADQAAKDDPQQLAAMGYLTLGRRFLGVESDVIDDKIDVVGRGMLGLTIGCARCHDHKYDPIPTADYYSLYGVFQNCIERSAELPRGEKPAPDEKYLAGLAEREKKLSDLISQRRAEAAKRIRSRVGDYLYAQRELEKYPDASFNTFTTKDEIIPGVVIRWEEFLSECKRDGHPILGAWLAFADLPNEQFADKAPAIAKLVAENPKLHPTIATLFQTAPASAREVADRYGKLFVDIDQKWEKAQADAKAAGALHPVSFRPNRSAQPNGGGISIPSSNSGASKPISIAGISKDKNRIPAPSI
jgi:cytochrome c553